jgi:ABC-type multidrug transport system ATPase subunit
MADRILYMESGKIIAQGTFEQLKIMIPNFNRQASLMGL